MISLVLRVQYLLFLLKVEGWLWLPGRSAREQYLEVTIFFYRRFAQITADFWFWPIL